MAVGFESDERLSRPSAAPCAVVALAASAGGLAALSRILSNLPRNFPAATVIVQHLDRRHRSFMASILSRHSGLSVEEAHEGSLLAPGVCLVAPPDRHLLVNCDGSISLTQTELVHFLRPSADVLFESVAASYKERAIAVVLSGTGSDGSIGVRAIKKMRGKVICQDPQSAEFSGMPAAAIKTGQVDFILPLNDIGSILTKLVTINGEIA